MTSIQLLIVEDDFFVAQEIQACIEILGFQVSAKVDNGKDAIQQVIKNKPDLAIMDIRIKGEMDGIETAAQLGRDYGIPIIYMTDQTDSATYEKAKSTSPHAFLAKPVTAVTLQRSIELALLKAISGKDKNLENGVVFNKRFVIKDNGILHIINPEEIEWLRAARSYCEMKLESKKITFTSSMKSILNSLYRNDYCKSAIFRIGRSTSVNIEKIDQIKGNKVVIKDEEFSIGNGKREPLMNKFQKL